MSQQTITKCDICGKEKGQLNRWVRYNFVGHLLTIGAGPLDCCSEGCMKTLVARVMANNRDVDHETTATVKEHDPADGPCG